VSMHAPDMVLANRTAGESVPGNRSAGTLRRFSRTWPDIRFETRRLYVRDGVVTQEWTATATHPNTVRRGDFVAQPTGRQVTWRGVDVIPCKDGLVKRKDVDSDSVSILRQLGLRDST